MQRAVPLIAALVVQEHGHRVRLAAEAVHRDLVTGEGLEFYPLAGNVQVLASICQEGLDVLQLVATSSCCVGIVSVDLC